MKHSALWLAMGLAAAVAGCSEFGVTRDSDRPARFASRERSVRSVQTEPIFHMSGESERASHAKQWTGPLVHETDEVTDTEETWAPWPFVKTERRGTCTSVAFLPFYWRHEDGDQGWEYVFPIYSRYRYGMERTTYIFPLYKQVDYLEEGVGGRVRIGRTETWIWPLFNQTVEHKLEPVEEPED